MIFMKKGRFIGTKISKYIVSGVLLFSMFSYVGCKKKDDSESEIKTLKEQIATIQSQNEELTKQIAELQAQSQELINAKNEEIEAKSSEIALLTSQIEALNSSLTDLDEQISNLSDKITSLEGDKSDLQDQLSALQEQKDELEEEIETLTNSLESANEEILQLQSEKAQLEEELENLTKFTITFDTQGGSEIPSEKYIPNVTINKPEDPTRKGYTFLKWVHGSGSEEWDFEHDVVNGNITLVAVWSANTYKLTYSLADGSFSPDHAMYDEIVYDSEFELPSVIRSDYEFVHWESDGKEFNSGKWTYDRDMTITCVWAKSVSTITYKFNYQGKADETQNVSYNSDFELLAPERVGYTFTGWTYNSAPISDGKYLYLGDITVYATWSANKYSFTLDGGDGTYSGETQLEVTFDSEFDLPICEPLSQDRPFAGWFEGIIRITDENGHSLKSWTRAGGADLVAKYFHPISTKQDFLDISNDPTTIYSLVNDIDFGGEEITSLDSFKGELWGMDYSIKNVLFSLDKTKVGLFSEIENAKFSHLQFKNCVINIEGELDNATYYVGLLAAQAFGDNEFEYITYSDVSLYVNAPSSKVIMGGLLGIAQNLTITNVTSNGLIEAKSTGNSVYLGGFVGESGGHISANNFVNQAEVRGYSLGGENVTTHAICEGLVGGLVAYSNSSSLTNCFNDGIVKEDSTKKTNSYVGGLIGKNSGRPEFLNVANRGQVVANTFGGGVLGCSALKGSFAISKIFNQGSVTGLGETTTIGGVIGRCLVDTLLSQSYNSGVVSSDNGIVGGLIGSGDSMITLQESFNNGTVSCSNGAAGGLIGASKTSKLWDCYNIGNISGKTYVGGLIATNNFPSTTISNSYIGGVVSLSDDSLNGKVGAFIGKSTSTSIGSSFVFATLIGIENYTSSFVGQYEGSGGSADNVISAATIKDLSNNVISEPVTDIELVSLDAITSTYISSTLLFNSAKWNINFDVSQEIYPTLKCFDE